MPYKQYTECVRPDLFVDFGTHLVGYANLLLLALGGGFVAFAVIAIAGGPVAITIAIAVMTYIIILLNWWLYGRLICLGDDPRNCAIIGMVQSQSASDPSSLGEFGDNDYKINLLLAPNTVDDATSDFWALPQGHLVAENSAILGIGKGYPPASGQHLKFLHCEFEGDGVQNLLGAAYVVLALLIASLWVPGLWIVAAIIALLALLNDVIQASPGEPGSGNPLDVNPNLGTISAGDVVVVTGEWVYDGGHTGWNEIHPIRTCQKVGHLKKDDAGKWHWSDFQFVDPGTGTVFRLDSLPSVEMFRSFQCGALKGAGDAQAGDNRGDPGNAWGIHPLVDGCKKPDVTV
jgi:hypothetical protein